jgi:phospholipid/cholesterol/gamma-HCH transport system permease protein
MAWPSIIRNVLEFLGEVTQSLWRFVCGKAAFSRRDLWNVFRECGVDALPIVTLTSMLLGLILAFVSSMQLKMFGAEIYVASLVGVSMVRVMGPVLTGIVLSGRTGASFAAVIGSMQVNEEVDALTGFGIAPMDFLVLPRVLGLAIMTPLLAIYADVAGIVGGFLVGVLMLDISPAVYIDNTLSLMKMSYVWIGLLHAFVFGFVISLCGCYQGIRSGRNASAVGRATTAAVVNSIVGIIIATSIITIIFTVVDL